MFTLKLLIVFLVMGVTVAAPLPDVLADMLGNLTAVPNNSMEELCRQHADIAYNGKGGIAILFANCCKCFLTCLDDYLAISAIQKENINTLYPYIDCTNYCFRQYIRKMMEHLFSIYHTNQILPDYF